MLDTQINQLGAIKLSLTEYINRELIFLIKSMLQHYSDLKITNILGKLHFNVSVV